MKSSYATWLKNPVDVRIGYDVLSIGEAVFHSCSSLTSVTIPDSVSGIGNMGFYGCNKLSNVTIPDGVTSI